MCLTFSSGNKVKAVNMRQKVNKEECVRKTSKADKEEAAEDVESET